MDETLETKMHSHPSLLLIQPGDQQKTPPPAAAGAAAAAAAADGGGDVDVAESSAESGGGGGDSSEAGEVVLSCLVFLAILMRNCVNKHVFSSSEVCSTLSFSVYVVHVCMLFVLFCAAYFCSKR